MRRPTESRNGHADRRKPLAVVLLAVAASLFVAGSTPAAPEARRVEVVARVALDFPPFGVATTPGAVWAASSFVPESRLARIDPVANAVSATIPLPATGFTWLASGAGSVWVSISEGHADPSPTDRLKVVRVDTASNAVLATIDLGPAAERPAPLTYGEGSIWATNFAASTVSRIDPATNEVVATITTTAEPELFDRGRPSGVATTPGAVWVMNHRESRLVRIDPSSNAIVASIATTDGRVAAGAGSVWVASAGSNVVERIDPATNAVVARIPGCPSTHDLVVDGEAVSITSGSGAVCRIDATRNRSAGLTKLAPPQSFPFGIAAGSGAIWASDPATGSVYRLEERG